MLETVERMIEREAVIHWRCEVCREGGPVDLEVIRAAKGAGFTLADKRPSCRLCPGRVLFEDRSRVYFRRLDIHTDRDPAFWAYQDAQRARLYALGRRVVMGRWVGPENGGAHIAGPPLASAGSDDETGMGG